MKTDTYSKVVLTIIAIALIGLFFKKSDIVQSANAAVVNGKAYALVPTNKDGSINVKFSPNDELDVNIEEVSNSVTMDVDVLNKPDVNINDEVEVHCNNCSN